MWIKKRRFGWNLFILHLKTDCSLVQVVCCRVPVGTAQWNIMMWFSSSNNKAKKEKAPAARSQPQMFTWTSTSKQKSQGVYQHLPPEISPPMPFSPAETSLLPLELTASWKYLEGHSYVWGSDGRAEHSQKRLLECESWTFFRNYSIIFYAVYISSKVCRTPELNVISRERVEVLMTVKISWDDRGAQKEQ